MWRAEPLLHTPPWLLSRDGKRIDSTFGQRCTRLSIEDQSHDRWGCSLASCLECLVPGWNGHLTLTSRALHRDGIERYGLCTHKGFRDFLGSWRPSRKHFLFEARTSPVVQDIWGELILSQVRPSWALQNQQRDLLYMSTSNVESEGRGMVSDDASTKGQGISGCWVDGDEVMESTWALTVMKRWALVTVRLELSGAVIIGSDWITLTAGQGGHKVTFR